MSIIVLLSLKFVRGQNGKKGLRTERLPRDLSKSR